MTLVGFARTYLLTPVLGRPSETPPYSMVIHFHAVVFFGWCVFFVAQCWFVAGNRIALHRRMGMAGLLIFLGMVVTGPWVAVHSVTRHGGSNEDLSFLAVSLGNVLAYSVILGAGFLWRRQPAIHKRLMMLGMVPLLTAPFGRLAEYPYLLQHVLGPGMVVIALSLIDLRVQGRIHPVTKFVGVAALVWEILPNAFMNTVAWRGFASWLVRVAA